MDNAENQAGTTLRGLAQVNLRAEDVSGARDWYADLLGFPPYFQLPDGAAPDYVEFRIGTDQDELGIVSARFLPPAPAGAGAIARWQVDDLAATVSRLVELGASAYEPVQERGGGFATASVVDPFGNILGLITSPHYAERHAGQS